MIEPNPTPTQPPVMSLSLSYRFAPGEAGEYLALSADEKRVVDKKLMTQLLMTDTFGVRQGWFVLEMGEGIEYLDRKSIRDRINGQLSQLAVHGHPTSVAKVTKADDKNETQAIYLIIPPHEHRTVYYEPVTLMHNDGTTEPWRLSAVAPDGTPLQPRVIAALSTGFDIPNDELTPDDRVQIATAQFFDEIVEVLDSLAMPATAPGPNLTNPYTAGGTVEPVQSGQSSAAAMARLKERVNRMKALHARLRR